MARPGRKSNPNAKRRATTRAGQGRERDRGSPEVRQRRIEAVGAVTYQDVHIKERRRGGKVRKTVRAGKVVVAMPDGRKLTDQDLAHTTTALGRLYVRRLITGEQHRAGCWYQRTFWFGFGQPWGGVHDLQFSGGGREEPESADAARAQCVMANDWLSSLPSMAIIVCRQTCLEDRDDWMEYHPAFSDFLLQHLQASLDHLAAFCGYRTVDRRKI